MFPTLPSGESPDCPSLRASDEHRFIVRVLRARRMVWRLPLPLPRPRVARAQKIISPHPSSSCYRIVGSKLTLAFMELETRQFASAFSINSLALAASAFAESVMVGFNVMTVN